MELELLAEPLQLGLLPEEIKTLTIKHTKETKVQRPLEEQVLVEVQVLEQQEQETQVLEVLEHELPQIEKQAQELLQTEERLLLEVVERVQDQVVLLGLDPVHKREALELVQEGLVRVLGVEVALLGLVGLEAQALPQAEREDKHLTT